MEGIIREQENTKIKLENMENESKNMKATVQNTNMELKELGKTLKMHMNEGLRYQGEQINQLNESLAEVTKGIKFLIGKEVNKNKKTIMQIDDES